MRILLWYRQDLRVADHQALHAAAATGAEIVPLFVHDTQAPWALGGASRWWLHHSLAALEAELSARGSGLVLRAGDTDAELAKAVAAYKPDFIYFGRRYEPAQAALEARVAALAPVKAFDGVLLREPDAVRTGGGTPYAVFTPYWRNFTKMPAFARPLPAPTTLPPLPKGPAGVALAALRLLPRVAWDGGLQAAWTPGAAGAEAAVHDFLGETALGYESGRDVPGVRGTSRLSPHLAFGEISPRAAWAKMLAPYAKAAAVPTPVHAYLRQLVWRDFAYQLLVHNPHAAEQAMKPAYAAFPWREPGARYDELLRAWQTGRTGYPLVDAGMRELWTTGWMHNRVRMVVSSFLVKHLLIPWQDGAAWFWDTLVDADLANNTFGWQWSAGSGADAAPYFRVFNPVLQGKKFDGDGAYVRRWVPELAGVEKKYVHAPWTAPKPPKAYPQPIVDHDAARMGALKAYDRFKKATKKA